MTPTSLPARSALQRHIDAWLSAPRVLQRHQAWLQRVRTRAAQMPLDEAQMNAIRLRLRRDGWQGDSLIDALALVTQAVAHALGHRLHDTQLLAAAFLLDHRAIEMATGEGKTLAMAAAAAVAGLSGVPVHVVTANDYLAERDARELAPLWSMLGLRTGHISPTLQPEQRRVHYGCDIVYATAKELAFDHLRDCLAQAGSGHERPVMRGLCLALLDEADSILLDEAVVPLVISSAMQESPQRAAQRRAIWWQAWQLTASLQADVHFSQAEPGPRIRLLDEGLRAIGAQASQLDGVWRRPRLRHELAQLALTARHALHKDEHYLVREGRIDLLDTLTGRVAVGRVWSQGLQALIDIKEGCQASAPTETLAQMTFQRFFQRYWQLSALSGTLVEARPELQATYGLHMVTLPTRLPSRRQVLPTQTFDSTASRWQAVVTRVCALQQQGRPVLIGTDSVADSEQLARALHQAGIDHTVLNARHDAQEAAIVAQAGTAGRVTVATRMAGRGTDIHLDDKALAAGGLHIIDCQRNESRRMDRQLHGRCARQSQPGSIETWLCTGNFADCETGATPKLARWISSATRVMSSRWATLALMRLRLYQWTQSMRHMAMRRHLMEQDLQWEAQHRLARRTGRSSA